jgi:hypothetical protein
MRLITLVCVVLLMGLSLVHTGIVEACSGGVWDLGYLLNNPPEDIIIATGRIHALSESGINVVLDIDQVITGDLTDKFIIFSRTNPSGIVEGRGLIDCFAYGPRQFADKRFVAALWRDENGVYDGTLFNEDEQGLFLFKEPDQPDNTLSLNYEQIIDYAAHRLNTIPHLTYNNIKPRPAAVHLKTTSGKIYTLPVDTLKAYENTDQQERDCISFIPFDCIGKVTAPNGFDIAYLYPIGSGARDLMSTDDVYYSALEGESAVFSPQSDVLTVWAGQELRVYATIGRAGFSTNSSAQPALLKTLTFSPQDTLIPGAGAWSSNGRTFAFSSQSGVWLWDALTPDSEPVLFLETSDEPIMVRHFSPAGNYLALQTASQRYHIDIISQREYPDGQFSPDDRLLAVYDTTADSLTSLKMYAVLPNFELAYGWYNVDINISQFEWFDENNYIYATCGDPIPDYEGDNGPGFDKPWCKIGVPYLGSLVVDGVSFDYDPITHSLATLIDGDTITVNGEIIELAGQTDSPIMGIELIPLIDMDYRNF